MAWILDLDMGTFPVTLSAVSVANHPMSRTAGGAFGLAAWAGVIAALPAVGYLFR